VPHPGRRPIRFYPSLGDDSIRLALVLDRRDQEPPHLPTLNKWQLRRCALCGCSITTGLFGTRAL